MSQTATAQTISTGTKQTAEGGLKWLRVTFTGKLASVNRERARRVVVDSGGEPVEHVSRRTSLLVVGMGGWPLLPDGSVSSKLKRADELNRRGARIGIISELRFLEMAGLKQPQDAINKTYSADHICDLLKIAPETLRRWELLSLVVPHDGLYDYQDIVSLQTVADLVQRGVKPDVISRNLRGLQAVLAVDRPLAQLKIILENEKTLLAEIGNACIAHDGQLTLGFDAQHTSQAGSIAFTATTDHTSEYWFDVGAEYEELERYDEAERAYRRAVAMQPTHPQAYFNLGNVLRAQGKLEAAAEAFRTAAAQDPTMATACYNLADVLEEQGKLPEAVDALRMALKTSPLYADAHFNLAHCLEQTGRKQEAKAHWSAYLKLDRHSEWAKIARQRCEEVAG